MHNWASDGPDFHISSMMHLDSPAIGDPARTPSPPGSRCMPCIAGGRTRACLRTSRVARAAWSGPDVGECHALPLAAAGCTVHLLLLSGVGGARCICGRALGICRGNAGCWQTRRVLVMRNVSLVLIGDHVHVGFGESQSLDRGREHRVGCGSRDVSRSRV